MDIETRDSAPHVVRTSRDDGRSQLVVHFGLHYLRGNASPYFSVTAIEYAGGREIAGGRMRDLVLEKFPELRDIVALYLADLDGAPMHAEENGFWWVQGMLANPATGPVPEQTAKRSAKRCLQNLCEHARVSEQEARRIVGAVGTAFRTGGKNSARSVFRAWIDAQRPRWKREAREVIAKYGLGVYGDEHKTPAELREELRAKDAQS